MWCLACGKVLWERGGMETNSAHLMCAVSGHWEVNLRVQWGQWGRALLETSPLQLF